MKNERLDDSGSNDKVELQPCPFCGGEAAHGTCTMTRDVDECRKGTFTGHFINCIVCGADNQGIAEGYRSPEQAAEKWNRRYARSADGLLPRGSYEPLTREAVEVWRKHWNNAPRFTDDAVNPDEVSELNRLCDMAISSLLYAQEIERLRTQSASESINLLREIHKGLAETDEHGFVPIHASWREDMVDRLEDAMRIPDSRANNAD